jgi:hypothetical protein
MENKFPSKFYTKFIEKKQQVFISKHNNNTTTTLNKKDPLFYCDTTSEVIFECTDSPVTGNLSHFIHLTFVTNLLFFISFHRFTNKLPNENHTSIQQIPYDSLVIIRSVGCCIDVRFVIISCLFFMNIVLYFSPFY